VIAVNLPSSSSEANVGGPLLSDYDPDSVDELRITDNNGVEITLAKVDGEWVLPEADNYPARTSNIESVLADIAGLQTDRLIARNATSHNRLEVKADNFQRRLDITSGDHTDTMYIGTSTGASATHMRLNDDNEVYLTRNLAAWEVPTTLSRWIDLQYFSVAREDIVEITLENENGVFEFVKVGGEWTYLGIGEDEVFDPESINSLLTNVSSARMTRPIGKEYEFSPLATVTLTVSEPVESEAGNAEATPEASPADNESTGETLTKTYTLQLGPQVADGTDYVLISSESEYYVQVRETLANTYLDVDHESLLLVEEAADEGGSAEESE
jgi:hypothetical protein